MAVITVILIVYLLLQEKNKRRGRYRSVTGTETAQRGTQEDDSSNSRGPRWRRGNLYVLTYTCLNHSLLRPFSFFHHILVIHFRRKLKQERTEASARKCTLKDLQRMLQVSVHYLTSLYTLPHCRLDIDPLDYLAKYCIIK